MTLSNATFLEYENPHFCFVSSTYVIFPNKCLDTKSFHQAYNLLFLKSAHTNTKLLYSLLCCVFFIYIKIGIYPLTLNPP